MLVLSRLLDEQVRLIVPPNAHDVQVIVTPVQLSHGNVKLGFTVASLSAANPADLVEVYREELYQRVLAEVLPRMTYRGDDETEMRTLRNIVVAEMKRSKR